MTNFETSIKRLEGLISKLETEDLPLEEGLKIFEESVALYRECKSSLDSAEKKIKVLSDQMKEIDLEETE